MDKFTYIMKLPISIKLLTLWMIIVIIIGSCRNSNKFYRDNGISFAIPKGYIISKKKIHKNGATNITIKPKRDKDDELICFVWITDSLDLDNEVRRFIKELKEEFEENNEDEPKFRPIENSQFGQYKCRYSLAKDSSGVIHFRALHGENKTIIISTIYEYKNFKDFNDKLELIKSTFKCIK